jgi:hypothetical protein
MHDGQDARGLRYALVTVLVFILLAKLGGEDGLRGNAQWVRLREEQLADALGLAKPQSPHETTYSRVLKYVVDIIFRTILGHVKTGGPMLGEN